MGNNTCLYFHINPIKQEVFYVGIGDETRPYKKDKNHRTKFWHNTVKKYGYQVIIIEDGLSWKRACEKEVYWIKRIGRRDLGEGTLVNMTNGGEGVKERFVLTEAQQEQVISLYEVLSMRKIAKKFNVSKQTISRFLKRNNIKNKSPFVLTEEEQIEIIKLYNEKNTLEKLSNQFNVSIQAILNVLKRNNIDTRSNRQYELDEHFFDNIDTKEKSYALGLFYSKGWNKGGEICLNLTEKDKDLLIDIKNICKSNRPLRFVKKKNTIYSRNNLYVLELCSKVLCEQAERLGFTKSKHNLVFPKKLKPKLHVDFIRGFFDGKGTMFLTNGKKNKKILGWSLIGNINFCSIIKKTIQDNLQINVGLYDNSKLNEQIKVLQVGGNKQIKKLMDWLYKDATIFLKRKKDKYDNAIKEICG